MTNLNNKIIKKVNNKIRSSGLYKNDFFVEHDFNNVEPMEIIENISYDEKELLQEIIDNSYSNDEEIELTEDNIDKLKEEYIEEIHEELDKILFVRRKYYEPAIFNKILARKSGLFPFEYKGKCYLAGNGSSIGTSCMLEYYQALTDKTTDDQGYFVNDRDLFVDFMGDEVAEEMDKLLITEDV